MSNDDKKTELHMTLGNGVATFTRKGRSTSILANVLGTKLGSDEQPSTIWLDRIIHGRDREVVGWSATGAISTVLTRK